MADMKKLVKTLGLSTGMILVPHIDNFLQTNAETFFPTMKIGGAKPDDGHFHPSYHCLMSEEDLFDDRLPPYPGSGNTAAQKKTFDVGHFWHGYLQAALVEMGFITEENVERRFLWDIPNHKTDSDNPIKISGTVDLLDVEIPGRGKWLVDIKSTAASTFATIQNTPLYKKYVAQVNVYGDLADRRQMMILIVNKENGAMREIQLQRDLDLLTDIYLKFADVAERLER